MDVNYIPYGNTFLPQIKEVISKKASVFVAIISDKHVEKYQVPDSGVFNEVEIARTRLRENQDFIIPIRYDHADFADFPPGIIGRNTIVMGNDFALALKSLLKELDDRNIEAQEPNENVLGFWKETLHGDLQPQEKKRDTQQIGLKLIL